jgi:all-trans-8'-apo-beta-carotenal 15,15'-oxygenase
MQMPSTHRMFEDLPREHGFEPLRVEGTIPPELRGTLYRNGPSLFSGHGERVKHWFDGDGAVSGVRFAGGKATGGVRVVQSEGLLREREAGETLYPGYSTLPKKWTRRFMGRPKNCANTSVAAWQERLFALFEQGLPTEVCPDTFETLGESSLGGAVQGTFSAHPHYCPARRALYNFGVNYGVSTKLAVYEMPDQGSARRLVEIPLLGATMVHDFIATDRHLVFFAPPLRMNPLPILLGLKTYGEQLTWKPEEGTDVIIVPLDDPTNYTRFTVEPFYQWHFGAAWEEGEEICVEFVHYADYHSAILLDDLFAGRPTVEIESDFRRGRINPRTRSLTWEVLWDNSSEFPQVSPRVLGTASRYTYLTAHEDQAFGLQDVVAKVDSHTGKVQTLGFGDLQYPSEPMFVPRADARAEDDGYLVCYGYDVGVHRSFAAVLDARDLHAGVLARAWFDHHVPHTFHGVWVSG